MSTIFITGVTGFVGRYTAAALLRRPDVERLLCLVRCDSPQGSGCTYAKGLRAGR